MDASNRKSISLFICEELSTLVFQLAAGFAIYRLGSEWMEHVFLTHGSISTSQIALILLVFIVVGILVSLGIGSAISSLAWSFFCKQQ